MSHSKIIFGLGGLLVLIFVGTSIWNNTQPGEYDGFAQCLGEKGATFYGAFWCPHCIEQKELFGRSEKHLPYVECSPPSRQGQTPACAEAGITSYPTWEFANGERVPGLLPMQTLSERTGCEITTAS